MTITSYLFWLIFLPVTLALYWIIFRKPRAKLWFILFASYLFYASADLRYLPLLLGLSLFTYGIGRWNRYHWLGIAINLAALGVFKYWNFGVSNLHAVTTTLGIPVPLTLLELILPLGISFYVFKHIGYLVDVKQKRYSPTHDLPVFAAFSVFFPQISAGPISNFDDTGGQLANLPSRLSGEQAYLGVLHITMGLAKKLLIADVLYSALQAQLFAPAQTNSGLLWAWASVLIYALQLYFDFSGYTDIVLGISYLLGIKLPPNFNNPYLATNPREFWQRWHMSLSMWFRLYLFTPLSRNLLRRWGLSRSQSVQYVSNIVTMSLVGLWHGAGWGFILWGLYHGILLNIQTASRRSKLKLPPLLGRGLFLIAILIGWALFLSPNLPFAVSLFANMAGLNGIGRLGQLTQIYGFDVLLTALIAILITASGLVEAANMPMIKRPIYLFGCGVLVVLCLIQLGEVQQFLYVQF